MELELELGLAPPNHAGSCGKRGTKEAFGIDKAGLPLILRDDDGDHGSNCSDARDWEMSNKKKRLVGWPPVKSAHRPRSNGGHVKVKMEGVPIGRKVDLSRHASYHQLHHTLRLMFPSSTSHHGDPYAVTYEEGDGDWMLVGDVPWEDTVMSAKRLKILLV
ncbi:auxin-responsive protein IAA20-like isoform X1 [Aegilops tauschii subsp. strangulata]|uniref:Auxin-responsive protein n=2 Tax=Aegilops tauschii subsp. strangulata TaxID=200361 RepID=A0A453QUK8_AEGTS|nr:auxin-responsive protein IAA20-like [Aegilops tauschii subsp. strangulata]